MPLGNYLASSYFPPTYYGASDPPPSGGGTGSGPTSSYRDRDAFAGLQAALRASGRFADVIFPGPIDAEAVVGGRCPVAVIDPGEWTEAPDATPGVLLRHVTFTLTLASRAGSARDRFEILDRLSGFAQNVVEGLDPRR